VVTYLYAHFRYAGLRGCRSLWKRRTLANRTVAGNRTSTGPGACACTCACARTRASTGTRARASAIWTRQAGDRDQPESGGVEQPAH
jgi:hypothetical protein